MTPIIFWTIISIAGILALVAGLTSVVISDRPTDPPRSHEDDAGARPPSLTGAR